MRYLLLSQLRLFSSWAITRGTFQPFVLFPFCFLMLDFTLNIRDVEGRPSAFSEQHHKYCFGFYLTCSLIAQN